MRNAAADRRRNEAAHQIGRETGGDRRAERHRRRAERRIGLEPVRDRRTQAPGRIEDEAEDAAERPHRDPGRERDHAERKQPGQLRRRLRDRRGRRGGGYIGFDDQIALFAEQQQALRPRRAEQNEAARSAERQCDRNGGARAASAGAATAEGEAEQKRQRSGADERRQSEERARVILGNFGH